MYLYILIYTHKYIYFCAKMNNICRENVYRFRHQVKVNKLYIYISRENIFVSVIYITLLNHKVHNILMRENVDIRSTKTPLYKYSIFNKLLSYISVFIQLQWCTTKFIAIFRCWV